LGLKISCVDISVLYNSSVCAVALHLFCETHVTRVALHLFCQTHVTDASCWSCPTQKMAKGIHRMIICFAMPGGMKSRTAGPVPPAITLVLGNGAYTIKAGFVTVAGKSPDDEEPRVIPNCIARDRHHKIYVASDLAKCKDFGELGTRRPVEKGFIINREAQMEIWDHEFFDAKTAPRRCDPAETRLILAERPNALPALQPHCDQVVFEEYGFASYYRGIGVFSAQISGGKGKVPRSPAES